MNKLQHRIENTPGKLLIGMHLDMSLIENKTYPLFSTFMPRKKEITNQIGDAIFDIREYPPGYYNNFNPSNTFTKWAAVEVESADKVPEGMSKFELTGGTYVVFTYESNNAGPEIFQYIFTEWLPASAHQLDHRPHFDIIGDETHEEIWIPILTP